MRDLATCPARACQLEMEEPARPSCDVALAPRGVRRPSRRALIRAAVFAGAVMLAGCEVTTAGQPDAPAEESQSGGEAEDDGVDTGSDEAIGDQDVESVTIAVDEEPDDDSP